MGINEINLTDVAVVQQDMLTTSQSMESLNFKELLGLTEGAVSQVGYSLLLKRNSVLRSRKSVQNALVKSAALGYSVKSA